MVEGALWPTKILADLFLEAGLGGSVEALIFRTYRVPRSSGFSNADQRLSCNTHYDSLITSPPLAFVNKIILVDDVFTLGRTSCACVRKLQEAYPDAEISVFAAMRTKGFVKTNSLQNVPFVKSLLCSAIFSFFKVQTKDTIVVWKLDRLARSLIHFTNFINQLNEKGVKFRSITEPFLDTTDKSSHSQFIVNLFAALAQLERDIIIERTKAGLASAKARGRILGAPKGLSKKNQQKAIICEQYFKEGMLTVSEICERVVISRATYYKYLRHRGLNGKLRPYKSDKE